MKAKKRTFLEFSDLKIDREELHTVCTWSLIAVDPDEEEIFVRIECLTRDDECGTDFVIGEVGKCESDEDDVARGVLFHGLFIG